MKYILSLLFFSINLNLIAQEDTTYQHKYALEYEQRIKKSHLNGKYIPKDVQDAMLRLDQIVDKHGQERFRTQPEDHAVRTIHFSFGRWMIVNWGFYEGSRLSHFLRSKGITYPDDMASTLMYCYHRKLNEEPMQLDSLASHYAKLRKMEVDARLLRGEVLETYPQEKN